MGGKTLKIITGVLFILYFTIFTSVLLRSFSENLKIIYLDKLPIIVIVLIFIFAITFSNKLGFKTISRVNLLILPVIMFCILFVIIANFKNYDFNGLFPILGKGFKTTFFTGLSNMFAFSIYLVAKYKAIISSLFLINGKRAKNETIPKKNNITENIVEILATRLMALYLATRYIEFGRFFQRLDAIFLLIWTIGVISYLCIAFSLSINIFKKITNIVDSNGILYCFSGILYILSLIPTKYKKTK